MPQQTYVVKVQTIAGRIERIEVKADTEAQAMTKAKNEDFVKRSIQAWEGTIR
jgi:hypothetical protein